MRRLIQYLRAAIVLWKLHSVEEQQREVVADLSWAVEFRLYAQRDFQDRSRANAARKEALLLEYSKLMEELA